MWRARLDVEALLAQIDALAGKQREGKHAHALLGGELRFGALGDRGPLFAKQLATTIALGEYRFGAVRARQALIEGKQRVLYRAEPVDMIVTSALAAELTSVLEGTFSEQLYSYRRGRSTWQAIRAFVDFIAQHRREHADPKARGLYVLRRDIRAYGDNIPVDDDSALWAQLRSAADPDEATRTLLQAALRPRLADSDQCVTSVPTGSSLQPLMCNLYLTPVDEFARTIDAGFYARSGDDILFAHPDASVAKRVATEIDRVVAELRLSFSERKTLNLYFTGSGRSSIAWPLAKGTTQLQYLGARVDFAGNVGLKTERARILLQHLRKRVDNTLCLVRGETVEQRAALACAAINDALDVSSPLCEPAMPLVLSVINDREQLRQLDYWIALYVAQRVTGVAGPRAFRKLSYRTLRRDHHLPSLVAAKHRKRTSSRRDQGGAV